MYIISAMWNVHIVEVYNYAWANNYLWLLMGFEPGMVMECYKLMLGVMEVVVPKAMCIFKPMCLLCLYYTDIYIYICTHLLIHVHQRFGLMKR